MDTTKFEGDTVKLCMRHYKFVYGMDTTNLDASTHTLSNVDPKVTCVTNNDTASLFIPQSPPQQQLATTLLTHNPHHHKHAWLLTSHNNQARHVCGGGGYVSAMLWQAVVEVVV